MFDVLPTPAAAEAARLHLQAADQELLSGVPGVATTHDPADLLIHGAGNMNVDQ